jgi:hypothetical protein
MAAQCETMLEKLATVNIYEGSVPTVDVLWVQVFAGSGIEGALFFYASGVENLPITEGFVGIKFYGTDTYLPDDFTISQHST